MLSPIRRGRQAASGIREPLTIPRFLASDFGKMRQVRTIADRGSVKIPNRLAQLALDIPGGCSCSDFFLNLRLRLQR